MTTEKSFLDELRGQYDKEFDLKERLDSKASNLLTVAGITVPLLFGFSSFLIEKLDKSYSFTNFLTALIVIGIFGIIASIFLVMFVFRLKTYQYVMVPKIFFNKDGSFNEHNITEFSSLPNEQFSYNMIRNYLSCVKQNGENNDKKASILKVAHWVFSGGMITIPITVGILLFNIPKVSPS